MKIRWSIVFLALFGVVAALAAAVLTASLSAQGIQAARTPEVTEVTVLVADRFVVEVRGNNLPIETIKAALGNVDLSKLAAMKGVGVEP